MYGVVIYICIYSWLCIYKYYILLYISIYTMYMYVQYIHTVVVCCIVHRCMQQMYVAVQCYSSTHPTRTNTLPLPPPHALHTCMYVYSIVQYIYYVLYIHSVQYVCMCVVAALARGVRGKAAAQGSSRGVGMPTLSMLLILLYIMILFLFVIIYLHYLIICLGVQGGVIGQHRGYAIKQRGSFNGMIFIFHFNIIILKMIVNIFLS